MRDVGTNEENIRFGKVSPSGSNQTGVRQYNERLILQLIRRAGGLPKADIARKTNLSSQTVSVIINRLLSEGLLIKQKPKKGKVGQPSVPISLDPDGAYSVGIKIGRRSMDTLLMGFTGKVLERLSKKYAYPEPEMIFGEIERSLAYIQDTLSPEQQKRLVGVGVAAPYGIGGWEKEIGAPKDVLDKWRDIDIQAELRARITPVPLFSNDATAACVSELVFGNGLVFNSFLYMFLGTFIGGGTVINGTLYSGYSGNAGAIGSMPVCLPEAKTRQVPQQLLSHASLWLLERRLQDAGFDPERTLESKSPSAKAEEIVSDWVEQSAQAMGYAIAAATAVIDFDGIIIDGALPKELMERLVEKTRKAFQNMNLEGLVKPEIVPGSIGANARALGGAILPLYSAFAPDRDVLLKAGALD